jgi:hypothetical protein
MIAMCLFHELVPSDMGYDYQPDTRPLAIDVTQVVIVRSMENTSMGYEYSQITLKDGTEIDIAETLMDVLQSIRGCMEMAMG